MQNKSQINEYEFTYPNIYPTNLTISSKKPEEYDPSNWKPPSSSGLSN